MGGQPSHFDVLGLLGAEVGERQAGEEVAIHTERRRPHQRGNDGAVGVEEGELDGAADGFVGDLLQRLEFGHEFAVHAHQHVTGLQGAVAGAAAQFRSAVLDTAGKDFVRTLRARCIAERAVVWRHILRNSAASGMIALSLTMIALLGATIFIEQIFALPGMGQMTVSAATISDVPMVMGAVLVTVLIVLVVNLLADLAIYVLNPKARAR